MKIREQGDPIPKSIGRTADEYAETRELRIAMQKETDAVKARESELRESIIQRLAKSAEDGKDTGAAGLKYRAQVVTKTIYKPKPENWNDIYDFIAENDRFDFLQKRLGEKAVADYVEETGEIPPGIERVHIPDVSITKIK